MSNLYGIESESDCRAKLDELLELVQRAEKAKDRQQQKQIIVDLSSRLEEYYKKGNTEKGESKMSRIEQQWFWPAVQEAHVNGPHLGRPGTWLDGLYEINLQLKHYRPQEK